MSDQQPLLPSSMGYPRTDPDFYTWREKAVQLLETKKTHWTVIALIAIDAACVLGDLVYTVLSPDCTPPDKLPPWLAVLSHISLAITSLFVLEILLTLWAFGVNYYLPFGTVTHSSLHLFDAVIILSTFILEVVLKGREREVAGLLIILRLWRLVKLVGGIAVGAGEISEEQAEELDELKQELQRTAKELEGVRAENVELKQRLVHAKRDALSY